MPTPKKLSKKAAPAKPVARKVAAEASPALPTDAWRVRMKAGDATFTEKKIAAAEKVLLRFLTALRGGDPNEALDAAVRGLNAVGGFDGSMGNFIETSEREELVPFLLDEARKAGAKGKGDLTEALREW